MNRRRFCWSILVLIGSFFTSSCKTGPTLKNGSKRDDYLDELIECTVCGGQGEPCQCCKNVEIGQIITKRCDVCGGTGKLRTTELVRDGAGRVGQGRVEKPCLTCQGIGEIKNKIVRCFHCDNTKACPGHVPRRYALTERYPKFEAETVLYEHNL